MKQLPWGTLDEIDWKLLKDLYALAPDCAKFIARRLHLDLQDTMFRLKRLENLGFLERVEGRFLKKKGLRRPKHMNHTYYELSRTCRLYMRKALFKD